MKRLLTAVLVLIGCATARPLPLRYDRPQETLREARLLGADEIPTARLHLQSAAESLERARRQENVGNRDAAISSSRASASRDSPGLPAANISAAGTVMTVPTTSLVTFANVSDSS
ncbi:MAG: hypothetical protein JNK82_28615, partial [Myxococcaceae bacterium]|nr:hypothetical protein [Myxococcaceae bacterium]